MLVEARLSDATRASDAPDASFQVVSTPIVRGVAVCGNGECEVSGCVVVCGYVATTQWGVMVTCVLLSCRLASCVARTMRRTAASKTAKLCKGAAQCHREPCCPAVAQAVACALLPAASVTGMRRVCRCGLCFLSLTPPTSSSSVTLLLSAL